MTGQYCLDQARVQTMSDKVNVMTRWLVENASYCETSQKHLDQGTVEQAYWNYGYVCGARDFLALIDKPLPE